MNFVAWRKQNMPAVTGLSYSEEFALYEKYFYENTVHDGMLIPDDVIDPFTTYNGYTNKHHVVMGKHDFILKDNLYNEKRKKNTLAPYTETWGSKFFQFTGMECHDTWLVKYHGHDAVLCGYICEPSDIQTFKSLNQSSVGTDLTSKYYTYADVVHVIDSMDSLDKPSFFRDFWRMFVRDACIGNRDRHEGNWGFQLMDNVKRFCPVFDNEACLAVNIDLDTAFDESTLQRQVYYAPASQFKMWKDGIVDRPMRTNYFEMLSAGIVPITYACEELRKYDIDSFIDNISLPDTIIQRWMQVLLYCRYHCLLLNEDFVEVYNFAMTKFS